MDRIFDTDVEHREDGTNLFVRESALDQRRASRLPEFEFGRLRVPDEDTHRLLLKAGEGGSY